MLRQATQVVFQQQRRIMQLEHEVVAAELQYMRIGRDMLEQFLIALDHPEDHDAFRERLDESLGFYRDEIAVREEHA
jgi:hypothetical protein